VAPGQHAFCKLHRHVPAGGNRAVEQSTGDHDWWLERSFRRGFPRVSLGAKVLLAEDERLVTIGTMTANINMSAHLIGRYAGSHLAAVLRKHAVPSCSVVANSIQSLRAASPPRRFMLARHCFLRSNSGDADKSGRSKLG